VWVGVVALTWFHFQQMIEGNPPNKRSLVVAQGLPTVINTLKQHPTNLELHQQALIVLHLLLAPDSQTKLKLADVRQAALSCGIVDVLQLAQRSFKSEPNQTIVGTCASILDILIADWS
jgi:hypothetical protein